MRKGKKSLLCMGGSLIAAFLMTAWPIRQPLEVETSVITTGNLVQTVLLSGTVDAELQPCIGPFTGRISQVFAWTGKSVTKGEILFKLDTTLQEQALAALYEQRFIYASAAEGLEAVARAYRAQQEQEWLALEKQLLAAIEASYVRAPNAGTVSAVYVQEGDTALEAAVLGNVTGMEKYVHYTATAADRNILPSDAAGIAFSEDQNVPVVIEKQEMTDGMYHVAFAAVDENGFACFENGQTVRLELVKGNHTAEALIPLSTLDAQGDIWVVRDGKVFRQEIVIGECSRVHAVVEAKWAGQTLVVQPERYDLRDGMDVLIKR